MAVKPFYTLTFVRSAAAAVMSAVPATGSSVHTSTIAVAAAMVITAVIIPVMGVASLFDAALHRTYRALHIGWCSRLPVMAMGGYRGYHEQGQHQSGRTRSQSFFDYHDDKSSFLKKPGRDGSRLFQGSRSLSVWIFLPDIQYTIGGNVMQGRKFFLTGGYSRWKKGYIPRVPYFGNWRRVSPCPARV